MTGPVTHKISLCKSIDGPMEFSVRDYVQKNLFCGVNPTCTCKAFEFSKEVPPTCKHIKQIESAVCGWREDLDGAEKQVAPAECPRCGGEAVMTFRRKV